MSDTNNVSPLRQRMIEDMTEGLRVSMVRREKTHCGRRAIPWSGHWRGWYKLHRWQKVRRAQLRKQPLCEMCFRKGKIVAATVADHVVPHGGDWNRFWMGELQSLCAACHNGDKQSQDRTGRPRQVIGPDGWPVQ